MLSQWKDLQSLECPTVSHEKLETIIVLIASCTSPLKCSKVKISFGPDGIFSSDGIFDQK